jgi:Transposase zinc-binding domain
MRPYPAAAMEGNIQPETGDFVCCGMGAVVCESACEYRPRRPEESVLYGVVAGHLETFLAQQRERGRVVPRFVERELRAFLDCGIPARGFIRMHCDACGLDRVLPYSCKRRGFCPSCGGRRMADTAAHLVDRVFPEVPVRQWVLSAPFGLRYRLA